MSGKSRNGWLALLTVVILTSSSLMVGFQIPVSWVEANDGADHDDSAAADMPEVPQVQRAAANFTSGILIDTVLMDPVGADAGSEIVVVWNLNNASAIVGDWELVDGAGNVIYTFPGSFEMRSMQPHYIHLGVGEDELGNQWTPAHCYSNTMGEQLSDDDGVALMTAAGGMMDFVAWGRGAHTQGATDAAADTAGHWVAGDFVDLDLIGLIDGEGMGRSWNHTDSNTSADFSVGAGVVINEIHLTVPGDDLGQQWIEIYNPGDALRQLSGWSFGNQTGSIYTFPSHVMIPRHGFLTVQLGHSGDAYSYAGKNKTEGLFTRLYANFPSSLPLQNTSGAEGSVGLYNSTTIVDFVAWGATPAGVAYGDALTETMWPSGQFVASAGLGADDGFGRDRNSNDTDAVADWDLSGGSDANGDSRGTRNAYSMGFSNGTWAQGSETLVITNWGLDLDLTGWTIDNHTLMGGGVTLPALTLPEDAMLNVVFDTGTDDLDFGDGSGTIHVGALGTLVGGEYALLTLWSGAVGNGTFQSAIWFQNGQPLNPENDLARQGGEPEKSFWDEYMAPALDKIVDVHEQMFEYAGEVITDVAAWARERFNEALESVTSQLEAGMPNNLSIDAWLSISIAVNPSPDILWQVTFSKDGTAFNFVVWVIPVTVTIEGGITVAKNCDGSISFSGELTIMMGAGYNGDWGVVEFGITVGVKIVISYPSRATTEDGGATISGDIVFELKIGFDIHLSVGSGPLSTDVMSVDWWYPLFQASLPVGPDAYEIDCDGHDDPVSYLDTPDLQPPGVGLDHNEPDQEFSFGTPEARIGETAEAWLFTRARDIGTATVSQTDDQGWGLTGPGTISLADPYFENFGWAWTQIFIDVPGGEVPPENLTTVGPAEEACACNGSYAVHEIELMNTGGVLTDRLEILAENDTDPTQNDTAFYDLHVYDHYFVNITSAAGWRAWVLDTSASINETGMLWGLRPNETHTVKIMVEVPDSATNLTNDTLTIDIESVWNSTNKISLTRYTHGTNAPVILFEDDMEPSADPGWSVAAGSWASGAPTTVGPASVPSSPNVWGTDLNANWTDFSYSSLSTPTVDLSNYTTVYLTFMNWYEAPEGWLSVYHYDENSFVSTNLADYFENMSDNTTWDSVVIELSGALLGSAIHFEFDAFAGGIGGAGWYLDNVTISTCNESVPIITDLTGPVAGGTTTPTGSGDYLVNVTNPGNQTLENVTVDYTLNRIDTTSHYREDFETSTWSAWTVDNTTGETTWERDMDGSSMGWAPLQTPSWYTPPFPGEVQGYTVNIGGASGGVPDPILQAPSYGRNGTDMLTSPVIDLAAAGPVSFLSFHLRADLQTGFDNLTLEISDDGGSNWGTLWDSTTDFNGGWIGPQCCTPTGWTTITEQIPSTMLTNQFRARWTLTSDAWISGPIVAIDGIEIYTETTTEVMTGSDDLGIMAPFENRTTTVSHTFTAAPIRSRFDFQAEVTSHCLEIPGNAQMGDHMHYRAAPPSATFLTPGVNAFILGTESVTTTTNTNPDFPGFIDYSITANGTSKTSFGTSYAVGNDYQLDLDTTAYPDGPAILEVVLTDMWGQTTTVTQDVTISNTQPPDLAPVADLTGTSTSGIVGTPITLDGTSSTDDVSITNYTWTFTDVIARTLYGASNMYSFALAGAHLVTLTVTDTVGQTDAASMTINISDIDDPPVADLSGTPTSGTIGVPLMFDGSTSTDDVGISNYTWTFNDGTPRTLYGITPTYSFTTAGSHQVTLLVTDTASQTDSASTTITISPGASDQPPVASSAGSSTTVEFGDAATFTGVTSADDVAITNYTWSIEDGATVILYGETIQYTFFTKGAHNVGLTVRDGAGQTDAELFTVTVSDTMSPTLSAFTHPTILPTPITDIEISVDATDPSPLTAALYYETDNGGQFTMMAMTESSGTFSATIPAAMLDGAENLQFYVEVSDEDGNLASMPSGGAAAPQSIEIEDEPVEDDPGEVNSGSGAVAAGVGVVALILILLVVFMMRKKQPLADIQLEAAGDVDDDDDGDDDEGHSDDDDDADDD